MRKYFQIFYNYFLILPKKFKIRFYILILFLFFNSILEFLSIFSIIPVVENFVDTSKYTSKFKFLLFETKDENILFVLLGIVVFIFFIKSLISLLFNFLKFRFISDLKYNLSHQLVKKYLSYDLSLFEKKQSATLIRNSESEASIFSNNVTDGIINIFNNVLLIISLCLLIVLIEPKAFIFSLSALGISFFIYNSLTKKKLNDYGNIRIIAEKNRIKVIQEIFRNFKEILIFNKKKYFNNYYSRELKKSVDVEFGYNFISTSAKPVIEFLAIIGLIVFIYASLITSNNYSEIIVELSVVAACAFKILPSINSIMVNWIAIKYYHSTLRILKEELSEDILLNKEYESLNITKNIELKNINFSHNSHKVILNNINLKIHKNEILGICGQTGSGKTTLVDVICGFRNPNSGSIFFDDKGLNMAGKYLLDTSYVSQGISLLEGSIKNNIAFGIELNKIDERRVEKALEEAKALDFTNQLKESVNSNLYEMASNLSGGQKQRFSIARAYYHDSDIIIMDEPTSALDPSTIAELTSILKDKGKTVIIISHDKHTLGICNTIYMIQDKTLIKIK